jgi:hypothetical protein
MRKKLATPFGKERYAKRITVSEPPFGNLNYDMGWTHLTYRGLKKAKGECLFHVIGQNLGIICSKVSIEQVDKLNLILSLSKHHGFSADGGTFPCDPGCTCSGNNDKNGFGTIEFGFAM